MNLEEILKIESVAADDELTKLILSIYRLKGELDKLTIEKYKRINPFIENLFDWKKKGELFGSDKNITIYDTCTIVGDVQIGQNTWIGPYSALDGTGGLKIGENCSISSHVNIISHDSVKWALSKGKTPYEYAPIEIGNCCFIGTGAMITKGVKVGNHCLIGAGAIITKDCPDNSIVYGVPGKIVGRVVITGDNIQLDYLKDSAH